MYACLDVFFFVFHCFLVAFNLVGWIWSKSRRAHVIVLTLTMISWFLLGFSYGFGYCPCTDWHWQVKRKLGEMNLPASYVKYYLDAFTGLDWYPLLVDLSVLVLGLAAFGASIYVNWADWKKARTP